MSLFDYIQDFEMDCPTCGHNIAGFQSIDGKCILGKITFKEVENFYSSCPLCQTWIEFTYRSKPADERTIDDYAMQAKKHD